MKYILETAALVSVFLLLITSCKTYKDQPGVTYLKNAETELTQPLVQPYALKIKPDDELQIVISSAVPQATMQFNLPAVNFLGRSDTQVTSMNAISTYTVSEDGLITIPNIGTVNVEGMTPEELSELLKRKVSETVNDPIVKVDLRSFKINVLGSVAVPGTKRFNGQRCTIFDAISAAGDITLNGRKDNVKLMREVDGAIQTHILDLTDTAILSSQFYYLQQNDVLIVDATDVHKENSTYNTMNSFRLQTTSAIVSMVSVISSLFIALLVK